MAPTGCAMSSLAEDSLHHPPGHAPQVLAAFRNLAISFIRLFCGPTDHRRREYYATHLGVLFRQPRHPLTETLNQP